MASSLIRPIAPSAAVTVQFDFHGLCRRSYWLVLEYPAPSVCLADPGFGVDLLVTTDTLALHRVWMGRLDLPSAIGNGLIQVDGPPELDRAFPTWLALGHFAGRPPALPGLHR